MNTTNTNDFPTTPEEDFAFAQLEKKLMSTPTIPTLPADHIPLVENFSTTINAHTGAQYQPMNTSPNAQPSPQQIMSQIAALLSQLVSVITPPPPENIVDAVSTVLEQADWFSEMVKGHVDQAVAYMNLDDHAEEVAKSAVEDRISDEIGHYMDHMFNIDHHVNIADRVGDILDDTLSDAVDSALDDKLEDAITEILSDKTITLNINP